MLPIKEHIKSLHTRQAARRSNFTVQMSAKKGFMQVQINSSLNHKVL